VTPSMLLIAPLAVLVVVLLFAFVGCSSFTADLSGESGADYPPVIQKEPSLVAYWRLQEPISTIVAPTPPGTVIPGIAKDEQGAHPGKYFHLKQPTNQDNKRLSAANPGVLNLAQTPGLLANHPAYTCVEFNGGYVSVDFDPALNPANFTVEAWITADFQGFAHGTYFCLFEDGAPATGKQKTEGFALYAGPASPTDLTSNFEWQVWMGDGTTFTKLTNMQPTPALVQFNQTTYLALTFDGTNVMLFLYYPETGQDLSMTSVAPLVATFPTYKPATTGSFQIGAGRNLIPTSPSTNPLYAYFGKVEEVALYNTALDVHTSLVAHEQSGGPF
jgi:Concanavalin A-like lectin/glucanases superfamily